MDVYLVGGAVRDELLGLPVHDRDWVVVGAQPQQMTALGYRAVGQDFPVFLHPQSGEEYALARTERKTGAGYRGFQFHADQTVTLEQDLARRDLTINAMARDADQRLVDPYGGRQDLEARRLRHVTDAFAEDPVRILRVARFAARLAPLGFTVAAETQQLMRQMVTSGEVDALVPERVWSELQRLLDSATPSAGLRVLRDCAALARVLPEVDALFGVPQAARYHPEIDTGEHLLMVLDMAARLQLDNATRYACLVHDLGKALTPADRLPSHVGHEQRGLAPVAAVNQRLRVPREHAQLARCVCAQHLNVHRAFELRPATVLRVIEAADGLRRPRRLAQLLDACEADARGREGRQEQAYPQKAYLAAALEVVQAVVAAPFVERGLEGPAVAEAMRAERVRQLAALKQASAQTVLPAAP